MYAPASKFQGPAILAEKQLGFGISVQIKKESSGLSLTLPVGAFSHRITQFCTPSRQHVAHHLFLRRATPRLAHRTAEVDYILTLPSAL